MEQRALAKTTVTTDKSNDAIYTIEVNASRRLDTLLKQLLTANVDGSSLSDADICDELNTFIFQGSLLTPAAISFTLVAISRHPSVQQKVLEELHGVWPKGTTCTCTVESLSKLKYLANVINESLRLYPPQPIIARDLNKNFNYSES